MWASEPKAIPASEHLRGEGSIRSIAGSVVDAILGARASECDGSSAREMETAPGAWSRGPFTVRPLRDCTDSGRESAGA